ncbi:hypothetical protein BSKO_12283 [Bryopsis sp. KO-2023]|nr:hypothetical protein BSKO_12283 [Bryopsis sp. KO-2023]
MLRRFPILDRILWRLSVDSISRCVLRARPGDCIDVITRSSATAFGEERFDIGDVTAPRNAQSAKEGTPIVSTNHTNPFANPNTKSEIGDARKRIPAESENFHGEGALRDPIIKQYDRLTKRAKLGRLRAKVSGPKADADTLEEWEKCSKAALQDIDRTTPSRFAFILESCSVVGFVSERLFKRLLEKVLDNPLGMETFDPKDVGMIVHALGVLARDHFKEVEKEHFLNTECHVFVKSLVENCRVRRALWRDEFDVGVLASIMRGLGLLSQTGEWNSEDQLVKVLGEVVARAFLEKFGRGDVCSGANISDFLHGCANYGYRNMQVLNPLREVLTEWLRVERNVLSLGVNDMVKLVWAFGKLMYWNAELMDLLGPAIASRIPEMSDAYFTHLVDSLGVVQDCRLNQGLVLQLGTEVSNPLRLTRLKRQQLAKIISGVGKLELGNPDLVDALGNEVLKLDRLDRFSLDELLGVFDGFARSGTTDIGLMGRLLDKCDERVTDLSPGQISNMVYDISLIKGLLENETKQANKSLRKSHTKVDPAGKKIIKEETRDRKDFVKKLVECVGRLMDRIPRGAVEYSSSEVSVLYESLGKIRNLKFDKMLELLKRYHSLVRLPRREIANWTEVGVMLETSARINLLASIDWPNFDVKMFYQFCREWALLNLDSGPSITSLTKVLWGLVRFSDRISMDYVGKVLERVLGLISEKDVVSMSDWIRLTNIYLCLKYIHGIDVSSTKFNPLFDLAKERWRENMKVQRSELKPNISKYFALLGMEIDRNVLVAEELLRLDMLVEVPGGLDLAIVCDEVANFQENQIDSFDYLSRHGHRLLMGEPYFRNEVLEASGYQVVLLPNYMSSKWKMAALTTLFIEKGLLIEEFSEELDQSFVRVPDSPT